MEKLCDLLPETDELKEARDLASLISLEDLKKFEESEEYFGSSVFTAALKLYSKMANVAIKAESLSSSDKSKAAWLLEN